MGRAWLRPGALRRYLERADVVHYPLTVPVPPARRPTVLTPPRRPASRPAGALPAWRAALPPARLRPRGPACRPRRRHQRVGQRAGRRAARARSRRVHAIHLGVDHERFTPDPGVAREPFLLYPARPWPHKNHARLFEAFARVRAERPDLTLVLTGVGHDASELPGRRRDTRRRLDGRARLALPARVGARLPEPLRGLRAAPGRGDGLWLPGGGVERGLAAGGASATRRCSSIHAIRSRSRRGSSRLSTGRTSSRGAASHARRRSRGRRRRAPTTASTKRRASA